MNNRFYGRYYSNRVNGRSENAKSYVIAGFTSKNSARVGVLLEFEEDGRARRACGEVPWVALVEKVQQVHLRQAAGRAVVTDCPLEKHLSVKAHPAPVFEEKPTITRGVGLALEFEGDGSAEERVHGKVSQVALVEEVQAVVADLDGDVEVEIEPAADASPEEDGDDEEGGGGGKNKLVPPMVRDGAETEVEQAYECDTSTVWARLRANGADTAPKRDHLWCCLGGVGSNGRDGVQSALRIATSNELLCHEERDCGYCKVLL
ncbi:hypothetical protein F4604DRAFT_1694970 [Suillus subluteus]|nr:hypothetical protein F4604DRAFT_1694970 [Suillus subluteus]